MTTRRSFLTAATVLAMGPRLVRAQEAGGGAQVIELKPAKAKLMGGDGPSTSVWTLGEAWPAPILRARQGEEFKIRFVNLLEQPCSLHWHGVRGPAGMMSFNVSPGAENAFDCIFTPPDAGTFWLGPVADVSKSREMGLYALLEVEEKDALPDLIDLPLILDDWRIGEDGAMDEASFGSLEDAIGQGRLGNWFTVNGSYRPKLKASAAQRVRMRLLNAANIRTMSLTLKGAEANIISLDGQPTEPRPLGNQPLKLAPGQRADLLFEPARDLTVLALDLFEDVIEIAYLERTGDNMAETGSPIALPPNPISREFSVGNAQIVPLLIEGGEKGGLKTARYKGEELDLRALLEKGMAWAFNGVAGLGAEPWQTFKLGTQVVFEVDNRTAFDQPLHIHGHVWRSLETDNEPWRETAIIPAKSKMRLGFVADNPGTWGLHSTAAERMDAGLFTSFAVVEEEQPG
jgi:FtsP/CotA-like multicopper oxidase with cupredoxin domain